MAAWHVEFHLIPRQSPLARNDLAATALEHTDWWSTVAFPSDYQRRLSEVAPPMPSSRPELETWGFEDGNRVEVFSDGRRVRHVKVLVDVRRLDSRFGAMLLNFIRVASAVLVRRDGLVVAPTIGAYAGALRTSNAWKFASDPAAFVISLSANDDKDT